MVTTSSDIVSSTVVCSEVVPGEPVAVTKRVVQETVRRQLLVYQGAYIDGFALGLMKLLTVVTGACDRVVS